MAKSSADHASSDTRSSDADLSDPSPTASLDVAVVGGGIIGVMTALGLLQRGMRVTIYERAQEWHEMGVGFAFTGVARECMQRLNADVLEALRRVGQESSHEYNRYWDGYRPKTQEESENAAESLLFQVSARDAAYMGCLRSHLLREMAEKLPEGVAKFDKQLISCTETSGIEKVQLTFADGDQVMADVVIGCDGLHSTMRKILLGTDNPCSYPNYSHIIAYRTVIPVDGACSALGHDKANSSCMHLGPDAVIVSYPIHNGTLLNTSIFVHDPQEWPDGSSLTGLGTRDEVQKALSGWGPHVREFVDLLPDRIPKWAIFDTAAHPAPTYARGRFCIAGDAAHASSPLLGAGACMGVEDALVLSELLGMAATSDALGSRSRTVAVALEAYSAARKERSQWLVQASREAGQIYQWRLPGAGRDTLKCEEEFGKRARPIWDFNVDTMVTGAKTAFQELLLQERNKR